VDVQFWHSSDLLRSRCNIGCWSNCGPDLLATSLSRFDPDQTLSRSAIGECRKHPHRSARACLFRSLALQSWAAAGPVSLSRNPNGIRSGRDLIREPMPPMAATLYCVCGKIAAGKTTLARRLAAEHVAVLICEDEWLVRLEAEIESFDDFRKHARRLRAAIGPHVVDLLRLGISVVLDVPANTPKDRAWIRLLFEAAQASHELHHRGDGRARSGHESACATVGR
jgi:AAA domain